MLQVVLCNTADTIGHSKSISKRSYVIDILIDKENISDIVKNFDPDFTKFYNYVINKL